MIFNDPFLISDSHFGHLNKKGTGIIDYCNRPFNSIEEHDSTLIKNWNEVVDKNDVIIHLGDFCFKNSKYGEKSFNYYFNQLNGQMILIKGNHDKYVTNSHDCVIVNDKIQIQNFILTHRPLSKNHIPENMINIHGHIHQHNIDHGINVSVEKLEYKPIKLSTVKLYCEMAKML